MALSVVQPPKGSTIESTIDIVAVHGLGGDAINTWTHPRSNAFWLKDFLPQQLPDARILTFGYNAAAAFSESTAEVIDHAKSLLASLLDKREESEEQKRPLIFIAHSLGGIVVKQALLQARLEQRYQSISDATLGIIFFGTPHRGSGKAIYGKVLANVAQIMTRRPPARLMSALQTNSDILLRLTSDFRFQLPQYQVISFYEQRPMKVFSSLIVEKQSALLEVEHEEQIPVDADHSEICKFETAENDTFEKVYKRILRMRKESRSSASDQAVLVASTRNEHFEVPHLLSPVFTGHEDVCQCLDSCLVLAQQPGAQVQRRFVLYGLGGSGKTQISLKYAQVHRERYWAVFWIDASTADSIRLGFTQIAILLQLNQDLNSVKRVLTNIPQPWLLIFDNADNPKLELTPYFPSGDRGDIIITSRNPECRYYSTVGAKAIGKMVDKDAAALLAKTISSTASIEPREEEAAEEVVKTLGYLALAIVQAGAYIRETSCSYDDYLELYHRRQHEVLAYFPKHTGTDYRYTVYTTWQVSVDMVTSMHDDTSRHALALLRLLCFYHHDQVPMTMFYNAWHNSHGDQSRLDDLLWPGVDSDFIDYRRAVQAAITLLASFSLITREADVSLSMHPLMHDWCQDRMLEDERKISYRTATSLLTRSVAWRFETADYDFRRLLVSHVHACVQKGECGDEELDGEKKRGEWSRMALVLGENGSTRDAIFLMEQVVQSSIGNLGKDHHDTLVSMHSLAIRYAEAGRGDDALRLTEQVLTLYKSKLGEDHPDTLGSMHSLAIQYAEARREDEALRLTEQVMALRKSKLGEDHLDTLASMYMLAIRYGEGGREDEALPLTEQVMALQKSKLGEDHPNTLALMHGLAIRYSKAGRGDEALRLLEEVMALQKSKLGEDHPNTLASMHSLAIRYSKAGRGDEALRLTEQVLTLYKSKLGEDHPETLRSMHNLAIQYAEAGRGDKALRLTEQVVTLRKNKLGEDHSDMLASMHNLAIRYNKVGREDKALRLTEQVLTLYKSKLGEDHPETLRSMHNLAIQYAEAGRGDEALRLMEQVVTLRKSKLGENHPDTLASVKLLAYIINKTGKDPRSLETVGRTRHRLSNLWRRFQPQSKNDL